MNDLTIHCDCQDKCGMTLTVLPVAGYFKLTMTPRTGEEQEPAVEWIRPEKLQQRLEQENCATFGVVVVRHYLDKDLDLDMMISDEDRMQLLAMAKGEHGAEANQEGEGTPAQPEHAGS